VMLVYMIFLTKLILSLCSTCFMYRKVHYIFSPSEAEQLLVIVISLFLERELEGRLLILGDCLNSLISYFTMGEWESHCVMATESIAQRYDFQRCMIICHKS
jgi:hypothetical protein